MRTCCTLSRAAFPVANYRLRGGAGKTTGLDALRLLAEHNQPFPQQPFCCRLTHSTMPAKHKQKAGGRTVGGVKGQTPEPLDADISLGSASPVQKKDGDLIISVHAKPGAKQNGVTNVSAEAISIHISAPAQEGEANAELVRFLAGVLSVRKSSVLLQRGHKSKEKYVRVQECKLSADEALKLLKSSIE